MANFEALKTLIRQYIKENGDGEITGDILQSVLIAMVTEVEGNGYVYAGIATPTTEPVTGNVFYIATEAGSYSNFGSVDVSAGITILKRDGSSWTKNQISYTDGVFDISAYNGSSYANLTAALGTNGANVPLAVRKGGMSVKFVNTSDNLYKQFRYMLEYANTTVGNAAFVNVSNWQGVDDEPTALSNNLVKSGGVEKELPTFKLKGADNTLVASSKYSNIKVGNTYRIWVQNPNISMEGVTESGTKDKFGISVYDSQDSRLKYDRVTISDTNPLADYYDVTIPADSAYLVVRMRAAAEAEQTFMLEDVTYTKKLDGGVNKSLAELNSKIGIKAVTNCLFYNVLNVEDSDYTPDKIIKSGGSFYPADYTDYFTSGYIECSAGMRFRGISTSSMKFYVCFYNKDKAAISSAYIEQTALYFEVPDNDAIAYMRVSMKNNDAKGCLFSSDVVFDTYVEYNKPIIVCEHMTGEYIKNKLLNGIESRFATNIFNPEDEDIVDGHYINPANGEVTENPGTFITGYIPCKCGDYLAWNGFTTSRICALYDRDKTYIKGYYDGDLNPYNTIPLINNGNIAYARFSVPNSFKQKAIYKNSYSAGYIGYSLTALIIDDVFLPDSLIQRLQSLLQSINALDERVENIEGQITVVTNVLNQADENYKDERILNKSTGNLLSGTNPGYMTTGFIPCKKGDKFTLYDKQKAQIWVCCYDASKTFIPGTGSDASVYEVIIPDNDSIMYVRVSYKISTKDKYLYNTGSKISIKKEYGESFLLFDYAKVTDLQADSIEASQIVLNGKDLSKRETRWEFACCRPICIGDSLTDGLYGDTSKGLINENYPYFLGRMLDCEVFNAGANGSYPSKFYSEWYPSLDFTDYDSVFLWFGTNRGLDTADSSAASGSPANEGYYYKQIIDGILSQNSSIKITLLTVFTVGGDGNLTDTNNFINATAVEYGLQVIDMSDLWVTGPYGLKIHANQSNAHFGKAGNILIADRIVNELSDWFESDLLRCEFGITTKTAHTP